MPVIAHERVGQYLKAALQVLENNVGTLRFRGVRDQSLVAYT